MNTINKFITFFIVLILSACTTYKAQYKEESKKPSNMNLDMVATSEIDPNEIEASFYLIGDAGDANLGESTDGLVAFEEQIKKKDSKKDYAIFLGDNIYQKGLPDKEDVTRELSEHRLDVQVEAVKGFKGRTLFIPGNHDWYNDGLKGLKRQEEYIEKALNDKDAFQPEKGCPIKKINVSEKITLVIIDTEWYLEDWDQHPTMNDDCDIKTKHDFFVELKSLFAKSNEKTLVVAMHHPAFTNGYHGGYFDAKKHLYPAGENLPLPILGSITAQLRSVGGVSEQDTSNNLYQKLMKQITTLAKGNEKVIFVSGHEHNLQYIENNGINQIVSGAGSKGYPVSLGSDGLFSYAGQGFAVLDVLKDGSSKVNYYSATNGEPELVFSHTIYETEEPLDTSKFATEFPSKISTTVYPSKLTQKSKAYTWLWGDHYRYLYGTKITVPVATLDTLYGGLKLLRRGGGFQTRSIKVINNEGKIYVIRAAKKSALQFLQAAAFTNVYIKEDLKDTYSENLALDLFTSSHPFANLTIPELSDAIGLYHTNPKLIYMPKHAFIGNYNKDHGDDLYVIEEHPDDTFLDLESFGKPDAIESTVDVLENILKDEKYQVDEASHIKARIFDILIGDWDRHSDQWKWARFNISDDKVLYRPIPRDRDQAFSNFDGTMFDFLKFIIPDLRKFQKYGESNKNIKWITTSGVKLDRALLQRTYKEEWIKQAEYIQEHITDEVIDEAFSNLPIEMQDSSAELIKEKLKERRGNIVDLASRYYDHFINLVVITGTHKDDYIEITRSDYKTKISLSRIKKGKIEEPYKERIVYSNETEEIWVYALDDRDKIEVNGSGKKPIYTRIVGGQNKDSYTIKNGRGIKVYDYKSKPSTIVEKGTAVFKFQDIYKNNVYDYTKQITKVNKIMPFIGFNPDDGFQLKLQDSYTIKGFKNNPNYRKFTVDAGYYFATQGFDLKFESRFAQTFGKWDFITGFHFTNDNYTTNFFGFGNETENPDEELGMDYNRVRTELLMGNIGVFKKGFYGSEIGINFAIEKVEVEPTEGRFITDYYSSTPEYFDQNFGYLNLNLDYNYSSYDLVANPKKGMNVEFKTGVRSNIKGLEKTYGYIYPKLEFFNPLTKNKKLVLKTMAQGQFIIGNDFEFFQSAHLGAGTGLRGYRKHRFQGNSSLAFGADMRYSFNKIRTSLFPIQLGAFGGYDIGRVWLKEESSGVWHDDFGGGFWINILDSISTQLGLFASDEGTQFTFGLGVSL